MKRRTAEARVSADFGARWKPAHDRDSGYSHAYHVHLRVDVVQSVAVWYRMTGLDTIHQRSYPVDRTTKSSAWKDPEMTKRFSRTMTDDQLRVALSLSTIEEIEAALAAGDLTQERMAKVATHRSSGSGEPISIRKTSELPRANNPMQDEKPRTSELITDVLKQLKSNKRN